MPKKKGISIVGEIIPRISRPFLKDRLQFSYFSDASPEPILITNTKGDIYHANPAWEKLTGYTFDEVKGENPRFLSSGKTPKKIYRTIWKLLSAGKSYSTDEICDRRKDGTEYQIYSTFFPIKKRGRNLFYVQIQHDITNDWVLKKALRESEKQLKLITDNVEDYAIFSLDNKGKVTSWSHGCELVKGYKAEDVIGQNFSMFYIPEDRKSKLPQANLAKAAADGKSKYEGWRMRKNKSKFWADIVITAIKDNKGRLQGIIKIVRDITDRRNYEENLRFQEQILSTMAEGVAIVTAKSGRFVYTNPAFDKLFGYEKDELIGKPVSVVNAPTKISPKRIAHEIIKSLNKNRFWSGEILNIKKDGAQFWCEANVTSFKHHEYGEVWISVQQDISTRKELEQQKNSFIGIASHELKTPITTLSAYAQILEKRLLGDSKNEYFVKIIRQQTNRLLKLIDDLLNVSRIESGKLELKLQEIDLNALVNKIVIDYQYSNDSHEIVKKGSIKHPILADENRIEQVIVNLINNAIKYSSNANKIIINLSSSAKHATVSIRDFGFGISKADQKHIFERFFRTKDKKDGKISGFGLGLFISSEIIKRHKGKIWVESDKGKGSTFSFSLPFLKYE